MQLATINSQEEQDYLSELIADTGITMPVFQLQSQYLGHFSFYIDIRMEPNFMSI